MVLKILKKKKVPDELPELAIDEILKKENNENETFKQKDVLLETKEPEKVLTEEKKPVIIEPKIEEELKPKKINKPIDTDISKIKPESGIFNELEKYLTKEIVDLNQLESWYNNKFLPRDIVSDMRSYWEKQKNNTVLQTLGKNFQEKITSKTEELQNLEREWQSIYFKLIEKEEEIRANEKELKKMLSDFVEVCKKRDNKPEFRGKMNEDKIITLGEPSEGKIIRIM